MTYITRIANKRILAKYFLCSLRFNYLHLKPSASRSVFSCYATYAIIFLLGSLKLNANALAVCKSIVSLALVEHEVVGSGCLKGDASGFNPLCLEFEELRLSLLVN